DLSNGLPALPFLGGRKSQVRLPFLPSLALVEDHLTFLAQRRDSWRERGRAPVHRRNGSHQENSGAMTSPRFNWRGRFCMSRISEAGSTPNAVKIVAPMSLGR